MSCNNYIGGFIVTQVHIKGKRVLNLLKNELYDGALHIVSTLQAQGMQAYFVGGAVRDGLIGKTVKDIDIVTSALPEQVETLFPRAFGVGRAFGVMVIPIDGINYEVATFREEREYADGRRPEQIIYTDDPRLDAARRDFTINAMFYNPINGELLDYFEGRRDLARGILRTVGNAETRFGEDHLRMLRAVRFCTRFGFEMDNAIITAIDKLKDRVRKLSGERLRDELTAMLTGNNPSGAVEMLQRLGLLVEILPEVAAMSGVEQYELYHPEGDVMEHTLLMLRHISIPSLELAWSVLLHDIGKVPSLTIGADGIPHFYGHEEIGAAMAENILKRLRFSKRSTAAITHAVRNHMRFAHVAEMRQSTWKNMMSAENFPMELELHRIDCISSNKLMGNYALLLDRVPLMEAERNLPEPLLCGADLIKLGLKPGPRFGVILKQIREKQLEGDLHSKSDALKLVQSTK